MLRTLEVLSRPEFLRFLEQRSAYVANRQRLLDRMKRFAPSVRVDATLRNVSR